MHATRRELISQRWNQYELIPELARDFGPLTPKLKQVVHILEWVRVEEYCDCGCGVGRPPHERAWIANAFV
ncbi:MAG: IS5/IS1182 family transposase, partial [Zoogloeaceae bacterium]|nr:IS5/IS1182 family transposase [Zoogloeaceae bacterium]